MRPTTTSARSRSRLPRARRWILARAPRLEGPHHERMDVALAHHRQHVGEARGDALHHRGELAPAPGLARRRLDRGKIAGGGEVAPSMRKSFAVTSELETRCR